MLLMVVFGPGFVAAWARHNFVWALVGPVITVALMLAIAALPLRRKVTPQAYADELQRHLDGLDDDDDWDETSNVRVANPRLEEIRLSLSSGFDSLSSEADRKELQQVIDRARRVAD